MTDHECRAYSIIDLASEVAAKAHQDQIRKGTDIPYITHLFGVALLLCRAGFPDEVIAAGILHDTVEDTALTLDDIRQQFGARVATVVEGCSEPDKSLSWEVRKEHTIEYLKHAPIEVKAVTCADKLHNLRTMACESGVWGEEFWKRFRRGREKQAWYFRSLVKSLEEKQKDMEFYPFVWLFRQFRDIVDVLFP